MEEYLLFDGQHATDGNSYNKRTGNYSFFGEILKFKTKEERDNFYDNYALCQPNFIKKGTRNTLRKYCLGMTTYHYNNYIDQLDYTYS